MHAEAEEVFYGGGAHEAEEESFYGGGGGVGVNNGGVEAESYIALEVKAIIHNAAANNNKLNNGGIK